MLETARESRWLPVQKKTNLGEVLNIDIEEHGPEGDTHETGFIKKVWRMGSTPMGVHRTKIKKSDI